MSRRVKWERFGKLLGTCGKTWKTVEALQAFRDLLESKEEAVEALGSFASF
jgi:hypothetical protein